MPKPARPRPVAAADPNEAPAAPARPRRRRAPAREPFRLGGSEVQAGQRRIIDLPISLLFDHTPVNLSVQVLHGREPGPVVFVSAALHGDEVNGVEVIRRLLRSSALRRLKGTLLAIPIVNAYGFLGHNRYLPDRRDLNRCFPGTSTGSLGSQLANLMMTHIVERCDYGIDLHSGAIHRPNLPQARGELSDERVKRMARAFAAPVMLNAGYRDGSLRKAAAEVGVPVLLYEASEALRFDEYSVRVGMQGVLRVLQDLDMISAKRLGKLRVRPVEASSSRWLRAPTGGIFRARTDLGRHVVKDQIMGYVSDPFGEQEAPLRAEFDGIVIGMLNLPMVNQGDALMHVARVGDAEAAQGRVEVFQETIEQIDLIAPEPDSDPD